MESVDAPHRPRPWLWPALAGAGVAAICLWRCMAGYLDPVLCGEDWSILFARYLWDQSPGLVLEPYAGYVSFGPQGIGWLCSWLPGGAQAYALAFAAGGIAAVALGWFASPRFAHVLEDARLRALVCVLLVVQPIADAPLLCTTMYAHWHMLFVVCLAAIATPPSARARPVELIVVAVCAWSHPMALLVAPLFAWRAWRSTEGAVRGHYACLALLSIAYLGFGVDWQAHVSPAQASSSSDGWPGALGTLLGSVILPSLTLNQGLVTLLVEHGLPLGLLGALLSLPLVALGATLLRTSSRDPRLAVARHTTLTLVGLALLIATATVASRWASQGSLVFASPRYAYVPTLLLSLWGMSALLSLGGRRVGLVALLLAAHALSLNQDSGVQARFRFAPRSDGRVARFATEVEAWARTPGPFGESRRLVLPGRVLEIRRPHLAPAAAPR